LGIPKTDKEEHTKIPKDQRALNHRRALVLNQMKMVSRAKEMKARKLAIAEEKNNRSPVKSFSKEEIKVIIESGCLYKYKNDELKEMCRELKLLMSGKKDDLAQRLFRGKEHLFN
jgi:TPP-dependent indolepyruvate ferredoxin oxidoreductase alpha subunit